MGTVSCFSCGKEFVFTEKLSLREECQQCRSDMHVCRNCQFYDPKAYNECREPQAENVREKDRANRCDYFQARHGSAVGVQDKAVQLKAAAEALFKKKI